MCAFWAAFQQPSCIFAGPNQNVVCSESTAICEDMPTRVMTCVGKSDDSLLGVAPTPGYPFPHLNALSLSHCPAVCGLFIEAHLNRG